MKKMIKMSLVAAVAVAGLTTTASASNLEDAIKDTKLTGYVRYRINKDHENETDMTEEGKIVAKITTPVNDMVTANVKTVSFAATEKGNTTADTAVTEANFVVAAGGATVIAGLQTSQSPFFANNGDTRSHGVTALIPAGPLTIAAAYYTTSVGGNMVASGSSVLANDVTAIAAIGKFGAVDVQAWYATVEDTADVADVTLTGAQALGVVALKDASAMNLTIGADLGAVKVEAMSTQVSANDLDFGMNKIVASGEAGAVSYALAYAMTNEDGGMVSLDRDSDAVSDLAMEILNMAATTDATAIYAKIGFKATDSVKVCLSHLSGSSDDHVDFDETDLHVKYAMSKNFNVTAWYAMGTAPKDFTANKMVEADFADSRIEFKYSF